MPIVMQRGCIFLPFKESNNFMIEIQLNVKRSPRIGRQKHEIQFKPIFLIAKTDPKKGNPPNISVSQPLWAPVLVVDHLPGEVFFPNT